VLTIFSYQPPLPKTWPSLQLKGTKPLEMITASGPFTLDDDFSFQPLEELLNHCKEQQPDVLVLMGPFISCRHPRVTSGKMESFPDEIFAEQVVKRLTEFLEHCKKTQVLLMPHMDDMITVYPLFPQPPLDPIKHERIHQLSNPSTISINGHSIAFGNMDVLFRLAKEEITK
jgi:DNA polymerase alpha subunit B